MMRNVHQAIKVTDDVFWVGAIDWQVRDFHGYLTHRGTTYNAYLVLGKHPTLIDTVKLGFGGEMLSRIASVMDPSDIELVVSNHAEVDHSGELATTLDIIKPDRVLASAKGVEALGQHFDIPQPIEAVADGDTLDLGGMGLTFAMTPMLHWPDSMVSYLDKGAVLFSQDAFGMHLAGVERFADQVPDAILLEEAAKYFANIVLPFAPNVLRAIDKLDGLGVPLNVIAPDHGPVWRAETGRIVGLYANWAKQPRSKSAAIVYDSMWGSTARMARAVEEGLRQGGVPVTVMPLEACHRSDVATQLLEAGALVVGSATLNGMLLPRMADVLTYVRGLRPKGLIGAAFGSYGWSGEAVKQMEQMLEEAKVEVVATGVRHRYVPREDALRACHELGGAVASRLRETYDRTE